MTEQVKRRMIIFLGMLLFATAVAGCGGGGGGGSICPTGSLMAPLLGSPADYAVVVSLSPTLSWSYPDSGCHPEGYRIDLSLDRDFADTSLSGGTGNPSTNWAPGSPLQPGREYWWRVAPINDTTLGPFSSSRRFYTGPTCDPDALAMPTLVWPADGEEIDTTMPLLEWANGNAGCVPGGYGINLSPDADFADTTFNGGTGNPSTRWFPGDPLADCTTYYWHVFAGIETTFGPESTTRSFITNESGTCAASGTGSVSGLVFHDLCALIDGPMAELPPGCIDLGDIEGWGANGIYNPGEPGIPGVRVRIGLPGDPKPTVVLQTVLTGEDGSFVFDHLAAGAYTIWVDSLELENTLVLIPGGWTLPRVDFATAGQDVTLEDGESLTGLLFGWDYQLLPAPPTPTPLPTWTPTPTPTSTPLAPFFQWTVTPDHIYYRGTNCGAQKAEIRVQVSDPEKTKYVDITMRLVDKGTGETGPWSIVYAMNPNGAGNYYYLLRADAVPDYTKFREAILQFQIIAFDTSGQVFERSNYGQIEFSACGDVLNQDDSLTHK